MRIEILTAVKMSMLIFLVVKLYVLAGRYQHFRAPHYLQVHTAS
jgi:hypothetical protein